MTPLKDLYERLKELQAKEKRYSEEEAEVNELISTIALREKYLLRYINHPPHIIERVNTALQGMVNSPLNDTTRDRIRTIISQEVNSMVAMGQVFGRLDHDDLIFHIENSVVAE